jgi:PAS domain S-box-containing protein
MLPWPANRSDWLASIVENSQDAIVGKTLDSVIRSWNRGATRVFGYTPEEAIGRSVLMLIPAELHDQENEIIARLTRGERVDYFETVRLRKDGSRIDVSLSVSPILDERGAPIGAAKISRDVTEANRLRGIERAMAAELQETAIELEQQIEEAQFLQQELTDTNDQLNRAIEAARFAQEQAEAANRAKSQFLAVMSHELRTPLNAIAGYVDLLELGVRGPLNDAQHADLARIRQNQRTLLRLIEDILQFAKLESGRLELTLEDVRLDEVLFTLESYVAPTLGKKQIDYRFEPCGPDMIVRADRYKVEQIMLNLLSNAVKFTEAGRIDVRCARRGGEVHIDVQDTGRGISADMLDAVFEPFVQGSRDLSRTAEGTGLGLAISQRLARDMGGDVVVQSEPGKGSTFTLILPGRAS